MSDTLFECALEIVLAHEGGFVDDPADAGEATNWGVSLRTLRRAGELDAYLAAAFDLDGDGDIDADDIRLLTREDAARFYRREFWDRYGYGRFHLTIAAKIFDLAVNMGPVPAARVLQRACHANGRPIADDGEIGPITLATVREIHEQRLLIAMRSEAAGFYRTLIGRYAQYERYRRGWLNRAYA